MGTNLHGGPVCPWPRRTRRLVRGCTLGLAALVLALVVTVASLVAADALGPSSGLLVVSLALGISTVVLLSLRGLGPLTVAFGCATLVVVASQAVGIDFLVAGQAWLEDALGRQVLGQDLDVFACEQQFWFACGNRRESPRPIAESRATASCPGFSLRPGGA